MVFSFKMLLKIYVDFLYFFSKGKPSIISIWAENSVGLISKKITSAVVVDDTTPQSGSVTCPEYIQVCTLIGCKQYRLI